MTAIGKELKLVHWSSLAPEERQDLLQRPVSGQGDLGESVAAIIRQVRNGGDGALRELTRQLDRVEPQQLEPGSTGMQAALDSIDPKLDQAIQDAVSRIEAFHAADIPANRKVETAPGLNCEVRYQALSPVGLYIPGGSAPLVSTVLMLAIPAQARWLPGSHHVFTARGGMVKFRPRYWRRHTFAALIACSVPEAHRRWQPWLMAPRPYPVAPRYSVPEMPG